MLETYRSNASTWLAAGAEDKRQKSRRPPAGQGGLALLLNLCEGILQEASVFCSPWLAEAERVDKCCSCRLEIQGFCSFNSLSFES